MLILGIATSSAIYLFSLPSPRTLVRRQTQHLGLRVARALAWSRESGRRVVMLSTGSGYIVAAAPATGSPGMADVNALGPGMNDDGAVGGTVSAGATVVLKDAVYGTTVTQVSCGSDGRCDTTGPFGAKFEITNGASVGQVFINGRGRVRIILPAR